MSAMRFARPHVRRFARAVALGLVSGSLLAACSSGDDVPAGAQPPDAPAPAARPAPPSAPETPAPAADTASAPAGEGGTVGGDGSQIELGGLSEQEVGDAALEGELACSFSQNGAPPLLFAKGSVGSGDPSQGVVKVGSYVEPVRAPGGFDGMTSNPTFSGQGKTIRIVETGTAVGGGESPPRPATLTYLRADGASRTFEGQWQCGP
ncbi:hypothetical protein [Luteimonas sp. FCS-9]|uniref:hypothetical protein n=1 Tax=Luteimonas sp. FCS-9 TaxID=1547516 RepID=UPI000B02B922|nr:hypothetical protein [Luteimonas sp. FCS-9]